MFFLSILNSTEVHAWVCGASFLLSSFTFQVCTSTPSSPCSACRCSYLILPEIGDAVLAYAVYSHNLGSDYSNTWKKTIVINASTFLRPKEQKKATLGMNTGKSYRGPEFLSTWDGRLENRVFKIVLGYIGSHETLFKERGTPPEIFTKLFLQNNEV